MAKIWISTLAVEKLGDGDGGSSDIGILGVTLEKEFNVKVGEFDPWPW